MKLKTLVLLSFLSSPFWLLAQKNAIDLIFSPDLTYRTISNDLFSSARDGESAKINWRFGFNYNRSISEKLWFKTGLRYASVGYQLKREGILRWGSQVQTGFFDPSIDAGERELDNWISSYRFWEIPLMLRYESGKRPFSFYVEGGLSPTIFATFVSKYKYTDGSSDKWSSDLESVNGLQLVGVIGMGVSYEMKTSLYGFAQPTFRYHFTEAHDTGIGERLFAVGVELGVGKRF